MPIVVSATEPNFGFEIGEITLNTHALEQCIGRHCVIHDPSDHPLKNAPLNWRGDRALMERICEHGIGHPDPDDNAYKRLIFGDEFADAEAVHGCCGCC